MDGASEQTRPVGECAGPVGSACTLNIPARDAGQVLRLSSAVRANLAALRDEHCVRLCAKVVDHPIQVEAGPVEACDPNALLPARFAETLSSSELLAALHETWGQFCLLLWYLQGNDAEVAACARVDVCQLRCRAAMESKAVEIHAVLWRIRAEQQSRSGTCATMPPLASQIPAVVVGTNVVDATQDELALGACEHAGMLRTIRWLLNPAAAWHDPNLAVVGAEPFLASVW